MEILQGLGEIIRRSRKNRGLSQEKLAELAGVHRTYIGAVERGEQNICFINLCKISVSLGLSLPDLLMPLNMVWEDFIRGLESHSSLLKGKGDASKDL